MDKKYQQIAAFAFGVLFVVLMLFIAVFIPHPSDFQYLVFRIVLALAAAGVAAMIPGFLHVSVSTFLRAGGALAVFAIVFFYNPASLVAQGADNSKIPPLEQPIKDLTPHQSSFSPFQGSTQLFTQPLPISEAMAADSDIPEKNGPIKIAQLLEGKSRDESSRLFDVTLSNPTDTQFILTKFEVKWRYNHGMLASVDQAAALVPIAKYIIDFPVNTDDEKWKTFSQIMSPSIALTPGSTKNPTLVTVRLQLHYHFAGRLHYHPAGDWNILFDIVGITETGERIPIFTDANWRWN